MIRRLVVIALTAWTARWAAQVAATLIARRLPPRRYEPEPAPGRFDSPIE